MNIVKRYFNRLIYNLANRYLTKVDFRNLITDHDRIDIKKCYEDTEVARQEMKKFLSEKGSAFEIYLEKQDHTGVLISGPSHHKVAPIKVYKLKDLDDDKKN
jgi:hypothetical protein